MAEMKDSGLRAICEAKLNNSLGWMGGRLSKQRTLALQYYRGDLFGNEQDGRSKVVSRDVAESIDGLMPSLLRVFAATDTIVSFQPRRKESEAAALQATDYLNYVFQTQPEGFDLLQTWIKDGLLSKLGVVKSWWDESEEVTTEEYEGLTRFQYLTLLSDDEIEPVEVKLRAPEKPLIDPGSQPPPAPPPAPPPPQGLMAQTPNAPPPTNGPGQLPQTPANFPGMAPNGPPQPPQPHPPMPAAPAMGQDDGSLYDCKLKRTHKEGRLLIKAIPPEEFLTDRRAVSLADAMFCAHRCIRTVSDLIEHGYPRTVCENLPGGTELDFNTEVVNRFKADDEMPELQDVDALDPALRQVWVAECYLKVDFDGDGVAEWRKVTLAGSSGYEILDNEPCEGHPFSAWTPEKMPHKLVGNSIADKTMDIQLIKSTVWRQNLDGMYFNNSPQLVVIEGEANMEDVLTRRPGGVIRTKSPDAVMPLPVQDSSAAGMQMLGYLDSVREARTGVRRWSPGLEGSELNPLATTATGVNSVDDASDETIELIARNFGEQGVKHLFKRMLELVCKHQDKAQTVRLRGKWVDIDPSTWDTQMDMEVMVGLGTGNKDKMVGSILTMLTQVDAPIVQLQGGLQGPLLTADNVYNKLTALTEGMGIKRSANFYTNPKDAPPPPPPKPDPKTLEVQGKLQLAQQQGQIKLQQQQQQGELDAKLEQERAERDAQREDVKAQASMATDRMHAQNQAALQNQKLQFDALHEAIRSHIQGQFDRQEATHKAQIEEVKSLHKMALSHIEAASRIAINNKMAAQKARMAPPKGAST